MATTDEFIRGVDAFLQAEKILVTGSGLIEWVPGREASIERCIKILIEVNGVQSGQRLELIAFPNYEVLKFSISVIFPPAVCRLDFDETDAHANSMANASEGLPTLVKGSHFHRWEHNKRFFVSDAMLTKLRNAEPLGNIRSFDSALRWFCQQTNIAIPYDLSLQLPDRDALL